MSSVNKVTLIGNLCADPEVRTFSNGGKVCNLRIATNETWKDKATGEKKERVEYHTVAIFAEHLVGIAERFLTKGSKVYVEGKLETRKWQDQSGANKYSTEVVLRPYAGEIVMLGGGSGGSGSRDDGPRGGYDQSPPKEQPRASTDIDDIIPF